MIRGKMGSRSEGRSGFPTKASATLLVLLVTGACTSLPPPADRRAPAEPGRKTPTGAAPAPRLTPGADSALATRLVATARSLLDSPYRDRGSNPGGFDCSGLTSFVFAAAGIDLPRTAEAQAAVGHWVAPDELKQGDLVFFGETRTKPHHVGLVVSDSGEPLTMIHASSSRGVIETEVLRSSYWLARLTFGRRVLGAD